MGYFIAFKAVQYEIKSTIVSEINLGIKTNAETIITINKTDLSKIDWQEEGKEMVYNGKRFDVVKSKADQTTVTFYCINDTQEETLFANLDKHVTSHVAYNKPLTNQSAKNIVNDIVKIFFTSQQEFTFTTPATVTVVFSPFRVNYTSELTKTNTPPPQFV
jgi:hypothetical protein